MSHAVSHCPILSVAVPSRLKPSHVVPIARSALPVGWDDWSVYPSNTMRACMDTDECLQCPDLIVGGDTATVLMTAIDLDRK